MRARLALLVLLAVGALLGFELVRVVVAAVRVAIDVPATHRVEALTWTEEQRFRSASPGFVELIGALRAVAPDCDCLIVFEQPGSDAHRTRFCELEGAAFPQPRRLVEMDALPPRLDAALRRVPPHSYVLALAPAPDALVRRCEPVFDGPGYRILRVRGAAR